VKPNNHGGARRGAGRPRKTGWQLCGFRLAEDVRTQVKAVARQRRMSQSELVNSLLKGALPKA